MKFIVTAGGQGTKLWPYSTTKEPKQFQPVLGETSLYQHNVDILLEKFDAKDIFVSTKEPYLKYVREQTPHIPEENIIIEPDIRRDRGPAEGYAFLKLSVAYPDEPCMIVQADCIREPSDKYLLMIQEMEQLAATTDKMITGGLVAEHPIAGIDYLLLGANVENKSGLQVHEIDRFVWRPQTMQEVSKLIHEQNIITHSNHMTWKPRLILEAYKQHKPDWYESLMKIKETFGKPNELELTNQIYESMEKGATEVVTRPIMDNGGALAVVLPYKWSDIGSWSSLHEYFTVNGQNYIDANSLQIDTKSTVIKANKKKIVATMGVSNLVIVDTDDALLVMDRDLSPDVGTILDEHKNRGLDQYL